MTTTIRDRLATPHTDFTLDNTEKTDRISDAFSLTELTKSELALRQGIVNWFETDAQLQSVVYLARNILMPLRIHFGRPFTPNSVFRSQELERALKGKSDTWVSRSQHTAGQAADIEIPGTDNLVLAEFVRDKMTYDQIIAEFYTPGVPNSGWIHVSLREAGNRFECLTFDGSTYTNRLPNE